MIAKDILHIIGDDQVPVSQDNGIEVKAKELSGGAMHPETGRVVWELMLEPGGLAKKRITFSIKYHKGKLVRGL